MEYTIMEINNYLKELSAELAKSEDRTTQYTIELREEKMTRTDGTTFIEYKIVVKEHCVIGDDDYEW